MVKLKDHLHVTFGEALVVPAHVVVPGPHAVYVAVEEIIQTPGAVCQLAEALCQSSAEMDGRNKDRKHKYLKCYSLSIAEMFYSITTMSAKNKSHLQSIWPK